MSWIKRLAEIPKLIEILRHFHKELPLYISYYITVLHQVIAIPGSTAVRRSVTQNLELKLVDKAIYIVIGLVFGLRVTNIAYLALSSL